MSMRGGNGAEEDLECEICKAKYDEGNAGLPGLCPHCEEEADEAEEGE